MSRSITKVSFKRSGKIEVKFVQHVAVEDGYKNNENSRKSDIKPHPDFFQAFQALKKHAILFMELTPFKNKVDEDTLDKFVLTEVVIKDNDELGTKITMSVDKALKGGKEFSIKGPEIDLVNEEYSLLKDLNVDFDAMLEEAKEYLDGKNGDTQTKLNFEAA